MKLLTLLLAALPLYAQSFALNGSSIAILPTGQVSASFVVDSCATNMCAADPAATSQAFTVPAVAQNGTAMVVVGMEAGSAIAVSSVTLSNSVCTTLLASTVLGQPGRYAQLLSCQFPSGAGGTTMTLNFSNTATHVVISFAAFSNPVYPMSLDGVVGTGSNASSGTTVNSNGTTQATSTVANDFIYAFVLTPTTSGTISGQPAGYTALTLETSTGLTLQANYLLTNSVGAQSPQWTTGTSGGGLGVVVPLRNYPTGALGIL